MADDDKEDLRRFIIKTKKEKAVAKEITRVCRYSVALDKALQDSRPCWIWQKCVLMQSGLYACMLSWQRSTLLATMLSSWLAALYLAKSKL